jgi:hypothetical protein
MDLSFKIIELVFSFLKNLIEMNGGPIILHQSKKLFTDHSFIGYSSNKFFNIIKINNFIA